MAKIYNENIQFNAVRSKIFLSLTAERQVPIFDVLKLSSGDNLPTQQMKMGEYDVYGGGGNTGKKHNTFNVSLKTLGIGRVGARCGCVFEVNPESWVTDNALFASELDSNYDLGFLIHYLNFKNINELANTSAQPVISLKRMSVITIPCISIARQRGILNIIQDVEKGNFHLENDQYGISEIIKYTSLCEDISIEGNFQLNLVKQLRQSFLREAMQGKLLGPHERTEQNQETGQQLLEKIKAEKAQLIKDKKLKKEKELPPIKPEEIPFEIPEDWVWCRLGEIAYVTSGSTPSQDAFVDVGIPYLKMYNLKNQKIDFYFKPQYIKEEVHNGQLKRCRAYPGDILMNIVGPPLGKIAIIPEHLIECNFNQAAVLIRPFYPVMNTFIFWYLNEMSEINSIDTKGVAGQANISVTQAQNMKIPLPTLVIQQSVADKLTEILDSCDLLEASIKQSQQQNEQLLQQVLREALEVKYEVV